ncbi:MAG: hypothetical protein Q7S65_02135 [Nanoarchaeota archaeon]|nr:hypothetical protein [Nanoarchaeota archaeon]
MALDTLMNPQQALNLLYNRLRNAYGIVTSAKPGDADADEKLLKEVDAISALSENLDTTFIRKVANDASLDAKSHAALHKLHELMVEMEKDKRASRRNQARLFRSARKLRRHIGIQAWKVRTTQHPADPRKLTADIKKKEVAARKIQKDLTQEKEQLKKLKKAA